MVAHLSLNDSKSLQVPRTFLSILADLNNAVVWMVSTRPHFSVLQSLSNPIIIIIESFTSELADGLSLDSELQQVSSSLLVSSQYSGRSQLCKIVSTRPVISKSSSPYTHPFVIVPKAPFTIGISVTFIFHSFFSVPL